MKKGFFPAFLALLFCTASVANADLHIDVTGVPGSGVTTWTFTTIVIGTTIAGDSIRDNSANSYSAGDTAQLPFDEDWILDGAIQNIVFPLTGTASMTIGGTTETISGIFLDDDGGGDDVGVRVANELTYLLGDASSWTGSGTINVDINTFALGSTASTAQIANFDNVPFTITFSAIPEPTSLAFLGIGSLAAIAVRRRRI